MNILIFNWRDMKHPEAGGCEVNIHELAKRWVAKGNSVTLFCSSFENCKEKETIDGIEIIRKGGKFSVYILAALNYLLHFRGKYDMVIDDINGFPFFTPLFVKKPKVAIVHHLVKDIFYKELSFPFSHIGYFAESFLMPRIYSNTKFVAVSESTKKEMVEAGFDAANIGVVYNGLNGGYKPANAKSAEPLIVFVGRIKRYKRLEILVRAMKDIREKVPNARLVIAGEGEEKENLERLVKELNLEGSVRIAGRVSDEEKIRLLQRAWVFVTPSSKEGWGVTVIEANACGTPVVAYDVPGLRESVIDGETGLLTKEDGNVGLLTKDATTVLLDEKLREKLSKNALDHSKNFSWDKSSKEFLKILEDA
jgi:glycosyltransferase involved in cell wall biosynthesis